MPIITGLIVDKRIRIKVTKSITYSTPVTFSQ